MRVNLKKLLFIGPASQKDAFIHACQQQGSIQFLGAKISLSELLSKDFFDVTQAIKILSQFDVEQTPHVSIVDPLSFSRMVIADKFKLEELHLERREIREQLHKVAPFGKIPLEVIRELESKTSLHFRLWTASAKRQMANICPDLITLSTIETKQYFLSLTKTPIDISGLEEVPLTDEIVHLSQTMQDLTKKINELEEYLKHRAALLISLRRALIDELDAKKRQHVLENAKFPLENRLFTVTGWVPESLLANVYAICDSMNIFAEKVPILPNETIPTYLENKNIAQVGEDLVSIYDTPSSRDKDPSLWVLAFFSIFFAMIVEDAGYGLIFLLTALIMQKKMVKKSSATKRFIKLITILGTTCFIWGTCTHSFFAIELSHDNPLFSHSPLTYLVEKRADYHLAHNDSTVAEWTKLHGSAPLSQEQFLYEKPSPRFEPFYKKFTDNILLELALLTGCIHLIVSICRYLTRNIMNAGWILLIVGGYFFAANYLQATSIMHYFFGFNSATSGANGLQIAYAGLLFSLIASIFKHGITGAFEITVAIQVFADILSYLRIYALALAGSLIASLTNQLAEHLPFIIAVVVLVSAHIANMLLSTMGGVIHGLRLNFLEWYHYSFEGGGSPFTPLKLEERL